ncbi:MULTISPECIES: hypothetical protein [Serratia]|uniref:Uncharacterized protein n=1 Tax=Serratia surfactantfaciens TaxID=2741499 RepID=A0ABS0LTQ7_9GAMM|nr:MULTISPECIES: hypothetical protein [Serratia]MBH1918695.1 hypothetical protein [Serratia surfactantfaciens]WMW63899.1 hypothetical protein RE680_04470 [Serratia marcescens]
MKNRNILRRFLKISPNSFPGNWNSHLAIVNNIVFPLRPSRYVCGNFACLSIAKALPPGGMRHEIPVFLPQTFL